MQSQITTVDASEYTESLKQIWAGSWRAVLLAERMGVPKAMNLSTREWVESLGGYVKLSIPERREAAKELIEQEGMSTREAAAVLGVDDKTVRNDLKPPAEKSAPASAPQVQPEPLPAEKSAPAALDLEDLDDGSVATAKLRATFRDRLYQAGRLMELKADAIAEAVDSDDEDALRRFGRSLSEWLARFEDARPKGLRVVGGKK